MPTYIYNYDSTNEADKAKAFQPRYLGGNILKNKRFDKDFESRGDPAIVLLGKDEYISRDHRSEDDCLSNIKTKLNNDYLSLVFSKMQYKEHLYAKHDHLACSRQTYN